MEPIVRRSNRIRAKEQPSNKLKYIEHIKILHTVTDDLQIMTDTLNEVELKVVISKYENLIGDLLGIN